MSTTESSSLVSVCFRSSSSSSYELESVKTRRGAYLAKGQLIAVFRNRDEKTDVVRLRADQSGLVHALDVKRGELVDNGRLVLTLNTQCPHQTLMKDMCADCGKDLRLINEDNKATKTVSESTAKSNRLSMVHSVPELKVSRSLALDLGREEQQRLLTNKKLVLLVDLDQTLIHTTQEDVAKDGLQDVHHFQLYGSRSPWYHTKLRPGSKSFLSSISSLYELHICTFGTRLYAHTIAALLDPEKRFFAHRILSRDECFDPRSKTANLSSLFPCGDHMVCIIDDRDDVWNHALNLVKVKPFTYFLDTGDVNDPNKFNDSSSKRSRENGPKRSGEKNDVFPKEEKSSNEASKSDELNKTQKGDKLGKSSSSKKKGSSVAVNEDDEDYLSHLYSILATIHSAFFELQRQIDTEQSKKGEEESNDEECTANLKTVVPYVRRKVLQNVGILFSGIVPNHIQLKASQPYAVAKSLGAVVLSKVDEEKNGVTLTHLIAARPGTAKVNEVRSRLPHVPIVTPEWLWKCAEQWSKVDSQAFLLGKQNACNALRPPPHVFSVNFADLASPPSSPPAAVRAIDDDDNDDDKDDDDDKEDEILKRGLLLGQFSRDDLKSMDDEVDQLLTDDDDDEDDEDRGEKDDEKESEDECIREPPSKSVKLAMGEVEDSRGSSDEDDSDNDTSMERIMEAFKEADDDNDNDHTDDDDDDDDNDNDQLNSRAKELEGELFNDEDEDEDDKDAFDI